MQSITAWMTKNHRDCDDIFVEFENNIVTNNWPELSKNWKLFSDKLNVHFEMEESILFPAFETATGMIAGPTMVMRSEHEQIRNLINEIDTALAAQDADQCQGVAETLMMMIQQHNMKEEQMLYPMTDQHVNVEQTLSSMQSIN